MRRRPKLVGMLWRWHRRLGLFAALLAILLAVTGISLNHSAQLGLDHDFVEAPWLYKLYGETTQDLPAYLAGGRWLFRNAEGRVYVNADELASCRGELVGGQESPDLIYVACAEELLLSTRDGVLVESITAATGLPVPIKAAGIVGDQLALHTPDGWRLADVDKLNFDGRVPEGAIIQQVAPGSLPAQLRSQIPLRENWLSWERVLLDLHSGRLGGSLGIWLIDIAGVMFCLLGISGVAMWWLHHRGGRRSPRGR